MDEQIKEEKFYYGYVSSTTYINDVPIEGILIGYDKDGNPIYVDGRTI